MQKKHIVFFMILLCAGSISVHAQWSLTGNSGTNTTSNFIGTKDNQSLIIRTNNLERLRILNKGFVGIGTAKPQALFHVPSNGSVSLSATDNFLLGDTTSNNLALDYNKIQARNKGKSNTLQLNPKGGAVAIGNQSGTTNPGLYVNTDGAVGVGGQYIQPGYALTVNQGYTNKGIYLYNPGGENYLLYGSNYSNRAAGMFVENIATDNQNYAIGARTYGTGSAILGISANGANGTAAIAGYNDGSGNGISGYANTGVGMFANSSSNYGLYAATYSATYSAYFNRSIFVNGSVYTSSDQKLKQNIQDFTSAMDIINRLQPKKYEYRQDGSYKLMKLPEGVHYGLVAQDVEKVLPNLVKNSKFETALEAASNNKLDDKGNIKLQQASKSETIDFKAVNYTELIPILIKGMQEQEQKIEQLTAQVNQLMQANTKSDKSVFFKDAVSNGAKLQQNTPNPFHTNTTIHYSLPQNVSNAAIAITDMNGRVLKTFNSITKGNGQLMIEGSQFTSGTYQYSLIIDGKTIDTKKMVILK